MYINLTGYYASKWRSRDNISVIGNLKEQSFINEKKNEEITESILKNLVEQTNSFFSVVIESEKKIYAAVDHLRMYPLFYTKINDDLFLSDNVKWLNEKKGSTEIKEINYSEFEMTGYVTGNETLYNKIYQIQAGEYLVYDKYTKELKVDSYTNSYIDSSVMIPDENIFDKLDEIHLKVFKRLIKSLNNRTAVLPLSAGYDSRVIALMLKKFGYEKVICFTYGKPGNSEALVSKKIASYLNYQWIFIPYTPQKWSEWSKSREWKQHMEHSNNTSSLAHIQDHLAVKELMEKKMIPDDSVFIPGHTAFLSFQGYSDITSNSIASEIFEKHYSLWNFSNKKNLNFKEQLTKKMEVNLEYLKTRNSLENTVYIWELQERHAKFICNSVRVYEQFGYEWRMPLWEKEFVEFWACIPQNERFGKKLYIDYFNVKFKKTSSKLKEPNVKLKNRKNKNLLNGIKNWVKSNEIVYSIIKAIRKLRIYNNHPLEWYKIISLSTYIKGLFKGAENINSFIVKIQGEILLKQYSNGKLKTVNKRSNN